MNSKVLFKHVKDKIIIHEDFKWVSCKRYYFQTHGYGEKPFIIHLKNNLTIHQYEDESIIKNVDIYKLVNYKYGDKQYNYIKCLEFEYLKIFVGRTCYNSFYNYSSGNTILFYLGRKKYNKYIYVGNEIISFETNDYIRRFISRIDKGDTPTPFAVGDFQIFTMPLQNGIMVINKDDIPGDFYCYHNNPYRYMYMSDRNYSNMKDEEKIAEKLKRDEQFKKIPYKVIHDKI